MGAGLPERYIIFNRLITIVFLWSDPFYYEGQLNYVHDNTPVLLLMVSKVRVNPPYNGRFTLNEFYC
jgi:hypothetical protein